MPPFKCLIPSLTMLSRYTSFYSLGPYSVSFQLDYFNDFVCSPVYCLLPSTPSPTPVAFTYPQIPNGGTWKGQNFVCFFLLWTGRTCHGWHARNVQSRSVWMRKVSTGLGRLWSWVSTPAWPRRAWQKLILRSLGPHIGYKRFWWLF